ncbi:metallo-beta-lactamase superfamily protein [Amylocarpus encephaloides]|uniref:Metallo-beta-lactamase superfamily protein n=1 Tax=Amylocarpus encephaloides TaxID=45428 RepID=A0A9P8C0V7_9HELO|nr:metallo-beta-lactamase superfamily protein [Amylocarpus encephaloides]
MKPDVFPRFEPVTATWQYVVADPATRDAVIIDSVLDFNPASNQISTETADRLLSLVSENNLTVTRILETHAHADHLTASTYLQQQLVKLGKPRPDIGIGARITQVQSTFAPRYGIEDSELSNVFDKLFQDNEEFTLGNLGAKVLHLPGHTPDHVGYLIGENVFTGDSIFNPDVGSARADFPGGSAVALYNSARTLLDFPGHYRLYVGHDYPPESRAENEAGEKYKPYTTVKEQREDNKHVNTGTREEEFMKLRLERDSILGEPRLLHQSLQWNIRAGRLPKATGAGDMFLHLPIKASKQLMSIMQGAKL